MPPSQKNIPDKICRVCGRRFAWQRRWQNNWDNVSVCSKSCRSQGVSKMDKKIEQCIVEQLSTAIVLGQKNADGLPIDAIAKVIWPSNWASHMPRLHDACRRLAHQGVIEIFHGSKKIDPSDLKGSVLLKLSPAIAR